MLAGDETSGLDVALRLGEEALGAAGYECAVLRTADFGSRMPHTLELYLLRLADEIEPRRIARRYTMASGTLREHIRQVSAAVESSRRRGRRPALMIDQVETDVARRDEDLRILHEEVGLPAKCPVLATVQVVSRSPSPGRPALHGGARGNTGALPSGGYVTLPLRGFRRDDVGRCMRSACIPDAQVASLVASLFTRPDMEVSAALVYQRM